MRAPDSKSWAEGRTAGCPGNSTTDVGFRAAQRSTAHRRSETSSGHEVNNHHWVLCEKPLQKIGFRRALLVMKPAHTGHHPGAVPGFRPSPGNSEETTTRVLTEEISVLFRVPTWDPTHPGSPVSRALPGTWEHTHPGAYSGRETRVFPGGRWEPRSQPRSWPRKNPGTGWIPGFSRVVLLGVANQGT